MSQFKPNPAARPVFRPAGLVSTMPRLEAQPPAGAVPGPRISTLENPLHKAGLFIAIIYTALLSGYLNELIALVIRVPLFLMMIVAPVGLLAALLSGRMRNVFTTRIGYFMALLVICYAAAVPFSDWRGNSLHLLTNVVSTNYVVFLMLVTLVSTLKHCRWVMYTIAVCGVVDLIATLRLGVIVDGRLALPFGSLANANDLAAHLLSVLPFCLFIAFEQGRLVVVRLLMIGFCAIGVYAALLTGSRGAFLSMTVIAAFAFWKASTLQRVALAAALLCLIPLTPVIAPQAWDRIRTIFSDRDTHYSADAASAVQSKEQRMHLLMRSIEVTLSHPLLGAGLGQFMVAEASLARGQKERPGWQVTHNTYTQVSSETGIPALICFLGVLFGSISLNLRIYSRARGKPELKQLALMSFCLLMSIVSIAASMTFASWAYTYYVPMSAGLSVAVWNAARDEFPTAGS